MAQFNLFYPQRLPALRIKHYTFDWIINLLTKEKTTAFEKNPTFLFTLADEAANNEDIKNGIELSGLTREVLLEQFQKGELDQLWNVIAEELNERDRLLHKINENTQQIRALLPTKTNTSKAIAKFNTFNLVALDILLLSYFLSGFLMGWQKVAEIVTRSPFTEYLRYTAFYALGCLLMYSVDIIRFIYQTIRLKKQHENDYSIPSLRGLIAEIDKKLHIFVLNRGILPQLREIINKYIEQSYVTELPSLSTTGLMEAYDPVYEIHTEHYKKLHFLLTNMTSGSIGIAGPRGAGKTTLMKSYCDGRRSATRDKPVFSFMTAAPVQYDPRDFMLHLASVSCNKLLQQTDARIVNMVSIPPVGLNERSKNVVFLTLLSHAKRLSVLVALIGLLLLYVGFIISTIVIDDLYTQHVSSNDVWMNSDGRGYAIASNPTAGNPTTINSIEDDSGSCSGTSAVSLTVPSLNDAAVQEAIIYVDRPWFATRKIIPDSLYIFFATYGKTLDFKPSALIGWGIFLLFIGSVVCHSARRINKKMTKTNEENSLIQTIEYAYASEAYTFLNEIKFQQSFTSGWSGSMKLPVGIEGGLNAAVSLAQRQLTLPEIADKFIQLMKLLSGKYQIIIGIDELDKIASDEKAQLFLNEIKGLFGSNDCFYLISVSESAMSSFERRGMPFRDAFDSCFDSILYVNYLNLDTSKRLLNRRIIGMPAPFQCFCFCMSGGLPRDLIRICRYLLELARQDTSQNDFVTLCKLVIREDLKYKVQANMIAANKLPFKDSLDSLLQILYGIEKDTLSVQALLNTCQALGALIKSQTVLQHSLADKSSSDMQEYLSFLSNLFSYFYYHATLLQFFADQFNVSQLKSAEKDGLIDSIARAKQFLTVSHSITNEIIDQFRNKFAMEIIAMY